LGDFGAASLYDTNSDLAPIIERVEVRAFGCLVEDVLNLVSERNLTNELRNKWMNLISSCTSLNVKSRLSFTSILEELARI
jgi:hypothetical protein